MHLTAGGKSLHFPTLYYDPWGEDLPEDEEEGWVIIWIHRVVGSMGKEEVKAGLTAMAEVMQFKD